MGARSGGGGGSRGGGGGSAASFGRAMLAQSANGFNAWNAISPNTSTTYHIPAGKLDAAGKAAAKKAGFKYNPKRKTYSVSVNSYGDMVSVAQSLISG